MFFGAFFSVVAQLTHAAEPDHSEPQLTNYVCYNRCIQFNGNNFLDECRKMCLPVKNAKESPPPDVMNFMWDEISKNGGIL